MTEGGGEVREGRQLPTYRESGGLRARGPCIESHAIYSATVGGLGEGR